MLIIDRITLMTQENLPGTPSNQNKLDFLNRLRRPEVQDDPAFQAVSDLIDRLSPNARRYLGFLTNSFLERDILAKTLNDPEAVKTIKNNFMHYGLEEGDAESVLNIFRKPNDKPDNEQLQADNSMEDK